MKMKRITFTIMMGFLVGCADKVTLQIKVAGDSGKTFTGALGKTKDGQYTTESVSGTTPTDFEMATTFYSGDSLTGTFAKDADDDSTLSATCRIDGKVKTSAQTVTAFGLVSVSCTSPD